MAEFGVSNTALWVLLSECQSVAKLLQKRTLKDNAYQNVSIVPTQSQKRACVEHYYYYYYYYYFGPSILFLGTTLLFTPKQQGGSLLSINYMYVHVERDVCSKSMTHSNSLLVGTKIPKCTSYKDMQPDIHFPNPATLR